MQEVLGSILSRDIKQFLLNLVPMLGPRESPVGETDPPPPELCSIGAGTPGVRMLLSDGDNVVVLDTQPSY